MNRKQSLPWDNPRFRTWVAVARAEKAIVKALSRALEPHGLKVAQLDILMNLYRHPGQSQHALARRLLVGRSNITMLLPQLEKDGLLHRQSDDKDRRIWRLFLTDSGEKKLMDALTAYTALIDRVMAQSSAEDCAAMGEQMRRVSELLESDEGS